MANKSLRARMAAEGFLVPNEIARRVGVSGITVRRRAEEFKVPSRKIGNTEFLDARKWVELYTNDSKARETVAAGLGPVDHG